MTTSVDPAKTRTVLFLCTGNYYRSRHAEVFFNHHATVAGIDWRATSRGLALERGVTNIGPMARSTIARLGVHGIAHEPYLRMPIRAVEEDFTAADLVVALKHDEHRPLMAERFPAWEESTIYWTVHDVDFATPADALPQIEQEVLALIDQLTKKHPPNESS